MCYLCKMNATISIKTPAESTTLHLFGFLSGWTTCISSKNFISHVSKLVNNVLTYKAVHKWLNSIGARRGRNFFDTVHTSGVSRNVVWVEVWYFCHKPLLKLHLMTYMFIKWCNRILNINDVIYGRPLSVIAQKLRLIALLLRWRWKYDNRKLHNISVLSFAVFFSHKCQIVTSSLCIQQYWRTVMSE